MKTGFKSLAAPMVVIALSVSSAANAYIGPGVGLGAIGMTIAIVLGVVLLLAGFLWYPLKRLFRRRGGKGSAGSKDTRP